MSEKNPYEKDETVDIPDFPSIKDSDEDIDRSIFKMNDDEEETTTDEEEEYYEEEAPAYVKIKKSGLVIGGVVMAVLLVLAIFAVVWGVSKNSAYTKAIEDAAAAKTTYEAQITSLNAQVSDLKTQLEAQQSSSTSTDGKGVTYKVGSEIDTSIAVRNGAGTSNAKVVYSNLSADLQKVVHEDSEGYAYVTGNDQFTVYETKDDSSGNTWGKIDSGSDVWVCVKYGDATWAYAND